MRPVRCALLVLWLLLAMAVQAGAPGAPPAALDDKRVLILHPYSYGRPGLDAFLRAYMAALIEGGMRSEHIAVEFLDLNRHPGAAHRQRVRELVELRHRERGADLVVTLQQPALDFALGELGQLAPAAPLVAIDTSAPDPARLATHPMLWLRPPELTARATLRQALLLFPATERLIVAVGAGDADQRYKRQIAEAVADLGGRFAVEYLDELPLPGMLARVAAAPARSIVLYASVNRDRAGATVSAFEMGVRIARAAAAPTFTLYSAGMGQGLLGGSLLHVEQLAASMAHSSLALLAGQRRLAPGIRAVDAVPTSMYDWRQLERWGADWRRLPPGTVYVNRPPAVWEQHRALLLGGLAVIALLAALCSFLWLQRRRLRVAEARYRVLVEHAPEAIVVYDVVNERFVDANSKAASLFGASREQLLAGGAQRFYADQQPDGMPLAASIDAHAQRTLAGEQLVFERTVRAQDGRCFPCEVSVVALPSAGGSLLRATFVEISSRKQAEQELARQRAHLEEQVAVRTAALRHAAELADNANRAKSTFLANMSHELRTPLNSIIGFSQIMAESTSMFDEEKRNLGIINRSGHHLLALINDILELSRIEAGQVRLDAATVHIGELLREVHDMLRLAAQHKGIALVVEAPAAAPAVHLDGGKLRQVLINLLSNAIKFTDSGAVTLTLAVQDEAAGQVTLAFAVRDTGIGIAEEQQQRIFEPFVQAAGTRNQNGTGLGLTISREFVRLLGGALTLQSAPGAGSVFRFSIGAARDPLAAADPAPVAPPQDAWAAPDQLDPRALQGQGGAWCGALRAALQQLDMRQVEHLVAPLRSGAPAQARALDAMLAAHQYRELCAMLDAAVPQEAS